MDGKSLADLMSKRVLFIPDYQRGYSWEEKQWRDFVQDIDALMDEGVRSHYAGTVVIYQPRDCAMERYGVERFDKVDVVDGQQRLTTVSLYLSIVIDMLIKNGIDEYCDSNKSLSVCQPGITSEPEQ